MFILIIVLSRFKNAVVFGDRLSLEKLISELDLIITHMLGINLYNYRLFLESVFDSFFK